ncbi:MAG: spondin domain-containing protein [Pseudomonadota bacterium]
MPSTIIPGMPGNDNLLGTDGDDLIQGLAGDDTITGGLGSDVLDGGPGTDTASFDGVDLGVEASLDSGEALRETGFAVSVRGVPLASLTTDQTPAELIDEAVADNLYYNIHTTDFPGGEIRGQLLLQSDTVEDGVRVIVLTATLDAAQEPGPTSDSEATGTGTVVIVDDGTSVIYSSELEVTGLSTADLLPVAGVSSIHLHNAPAGVNGPVITDIIQDAGGDINGVAQSPAADTGDGDVFRETSENDVIIGFENLSGSSDGDVLEGSSGANLIEGLDGNDVLRGLGGGDTLFGGAGDDTLAGGGGADTIDGGDGFDIYDFSDINAAAADPSIAGVTVNLNADGTGDAMYLGGGGVAGAPVIMETFTGIEGAIGSVNDDTIIATGAAGNLIDGGAGDDFIAGGGGTDTLDGGDGIDTNSFSTIGVGVVADLGTGIAAYQPAPGVTVQENFANFENLDGSAQDDLLFGDGGSNVLAGNDGNDMLEGRGGSDVIEGGAGDDEILGGGGSDFTDGGDGVDTVSFADIGVGVTANLAEEAAVYVVGDNQIVDQVLNFENITGSASDDNLTGDAGDNLIAGGDGADSLNGGAGNDILRGDAVGDGEAVTVTINNTLPEGGTFATPLWFGFHDGNLDTDPSGLSSFDFWTEGEAASLGLERIAEDGTVETISAEFNQQTGDGGVDATLLGENGFIAPGETATFTINVNPDDVGQGFFSWGLMVIPSNDAFLAVPDDPLADPIFDEDGNFIGDQLVIVRTGADVIDAGTEVNNELDAAFLNQTAPNTGLDENGVALFHPGFNGSAGNPVGDGDQLVLGGTTPGGVIDPIIGDFTLDDDVLLTIDIDLLTGSNDVLNGGAGDDTLEGGGGSDVFVVGSGSGMDVVVDFEAGTDGDQVDVSTLGFAMLSDVLDASMDDGGDLVIDLGGSDSITLENVLAGDLVEENFIFADDDLDLVGSPEADTLTGGNGDDRIVGLDGDDDLFGDAGMDLIVAGAGDDSASGGSGDDIVRGGDGDDMLFGGDGVDRLIGSGGDDTISGGADADVLAGNAGEDVLDGGFGDDRVLGGADNDDLQGGAGDDVLAGGGGDDILAGGTGDDVLIGNAGDDQLAGGAGNDVLRSGGGQDTFVFITGGGRDVGVDFSVANDFLDFSGSALAGLSAEEILDAGRQVSTATVFDLGGDGLAVLRATDLDDLTVDNILV